MSKIYTSFSDLNYKVDFLNCLVLKKYYLQKLGFLSMCLQEEQMSKNIIIQTNFPPYDAPPRHHMFNLELFELNEGIS